MVAWPGKQEAGSYGGAGFQRPRRVFCGAFFQHPHRVFGGALFPLPHHVFLQQLDGDGEQDDILHQEGHNAGHRWEAAGGLCPAVRHEWNDADGAKEGGNRS